MADQNTNLPVVITEERLDLAMGAVKKYVVQQDESLDTSLKEYADNVAKTAADTAEANSNKHADDAVSALETSVQGKLDTITTNVTTAQADIQTNKENIGKVEAKLTSIPEGETAQPSSDALTSIAGLTGTGVVTMTGPDTFAVSEIGDEYVAEDSALKSAVTAFAAKDGSVKTSAILDADGNAYIANGTVTVNMGSDTKELVLETKADANGKPAVYMKDPTTGNKLRVAGVDEVKDLISASEAGVPRYRGKFDFYATDKALITNAVAENTAVVLNTDGTVETGVYADDSWSWTAEEWNGGDWAWVEDILGVESVTEGASGRVMWNKDKKSFDVFEDREGGAGKPDDFGITLNEDGLLSLKMTTDPDKYGQTEVSAALNAGNIGYKDGMTIEQKIDELNYRVATKEEIEALIQKYFPTETDNPTEP